MPSIKETEFESLTRKYSQSRNLNPENINNLIIYFIDKNESYDRTYTRRHISEFLKNFEELKSVLFKYRSFEIEKKVQTIKKILRILYSLYLFTDDKYEYCDDLYNYFLMLSKLYDDLGYGTQSINNINIVEGSYYVGCYFKHQKIKNYF